MIKNMCISHSNSLSTINGLGKKKLIKKEGLVNSSQRAQTPVFSEQKAINVRRLGNILCLLKALTI